MRLFDAAFLFLFSFLVFGIVLIYRRGVASRRFLDLLTQALNRFREFEGQVFLSSSEKLAKIASLSGLTVESASACGCRAVEEQTKVVLDYFSYTLGGAKGGEKIDQVSLSHGRNSLLLNFRQGVLEAVVVNDRARSIAILAAIGGREVAGRFRQAALSLYRSQC